jgi:tetratricopeptide (TPR) repeat protein
VADSPRIAELRRRVQAEPGSIAFAQLAEELRRSGAYEEAADACRAGLARHPAYLSARVTLGRALLELGHLDDAHVELLTVIGSAPDNLAAIRGLAEIHQKRGELGEALNYYQRALDMARQDPDLAETVARLRAEVAPPEPAPEPGPPPKVEELFDFDALMNQLGIDEGEEAPPTVLDVPQSREGAPTGVPGALAEPFLPDDHLAALERDLRALDERRPAAPVNATTDAGRPAGADSPPGLPGVPVDGEPGAEDDPLAAFTGASAELSSDDAVAAELDHWLAALDADRQ